MQKSLLEIQQSVRKVEQQINVLANAITEIYKDIDNLRNDDVVFIDYKKVQLLSTSIKFKSHPLRKLSDKKLSQAYIELLLRLVHLDKDIEHTTDRLVFVQWIAKQAKSESSLEELFEGALKRDTYNLTLVVETLPSEYNDYLILDSLLLANLCGKAKEEVLYFVIDLCGFLGMTKDKLRRLSIIAKSILQQDTEAINKSDLRDLTLLAKQFEYYYERDVISRGISNQRKLAARINRRVCYELGWKKGTGSYVNKGDIICMYRSILKPSDNNKCIVEAPCEGKLYIFEEKIISYVVIHNENDNLADVKAWALLRR